MDKKRIRPLLNGKEAIALYNAPLPASSSRRTQWSWWTTMTILILMGMGICSCVTDRQNTSVPPVLAEQLPINAPLEPGLTAHYRYSFYRHIDVMPTDYNMVSKGTPGPPILILDHRFEGNVFDSTRDKGVGVFLQGYLKLETAGTYQFKAMSNDGIRVVVNSEMVVLDPTVHKDRFSKIGEVTVMEPGWYPLTVKYFQRKGTARLELHWQTPGSNSFSIVPAAAYGHLK